LNRQKEYQSNRIQTASPLELIRILYEAAVQAVDEALAALNSGDILKRGQAVNKAIAILSELRMSLRNDVHAEYCGTLAGLYGYMQQQLIRAHAEKSENLLQEVARLLRTLLDGWIGAMENLAAANADSHTAAEPKRETPPANDASPYSDDLPTVRPPARSWQV